MLMERASEFRRLRAPQEDGQKLIDPPWSALSEVVAALRWVADGHAKGKVVITDATGH